MAAGITVSKTSAYIGVQIDPEVRPAAGRLIPFTLESSSINPSPITITVPNRAYGGLDASRRRTRTDYGGDISGNLHPGAIDLYIEGLCQERFRGTKPSGVTVTANASSAATSLTFSAAVPLYSEFTLTGSGHAGITYQVIDAPASGNARTIQPALGGNVTSGAAVTFTIYSGDKLVSGLLPRYLFYQDRIPQGEGGQLDYNSYPGTQLTGGSLSLEADSLVGFNASVISRDFGTDTSESLGVRSLTPAEREVISSGIDIKKFVIKGATGSTNLGTTERELEMLNATLSVTPSSVRRQTVIGKDKLKGVAIGALNCMVEGRGYYDENYQAFAKAFLANENFSMILEAEAVPRMCYRFTFPSCEFDQATYNVPADPGADVEVPLRIKPLAIEDATSSGLNDPQFADRQIPASPMVVERNI